MELTRRDFLRMTSVLAAGAVLASCKPAAPAPPPAKEEKPAEVEEKPAKPEKVIELVWMCRTNPVENPWEEEIAKPGFEATHPNIKIKVMIIDQPDIGVKREAMIAAGEPLHVWSPNWGGDGFASDRYRGLLENLTPLIESSGFDNSDFIPYPWHCYEIEGKVYGIPLLTCGSYVYLNKDLFEEAGVDMPPTDWDDTSWTWDAMLSLAKKLTHDYDDIGKAVYGLSFPQLNLEGLPLIWGHMVWDDKAYDTGFVTKVTCADEISIKAYQARHDLMYKHRVMPDASVSEALGELGGTFQSSKVAMNGTGGWGHWNYFGLWEEEKAGEQAFKWRAVPMPYGDTSYKGPRTIIYTDPWCITAGLPQDEKEASWEFIAYLTSKEPAWAFTEATGTPPVRKSLLEDYFDLYKETMTHDEAKEGFLGAFDYGIESSNHLLIRWEELNETWTNLLATLWNEPDAKAADVMPKVEKAVQEAADRIREEEA